MPAQKSNLMLLKRGDGGSPETFTTLAGIRAKGLSINNNPIDVTTDDNVSPIGALEEIAREEPRLQVLLDRLSNGGAQLGEVRAVLDATLKASGSKVTSAMIIEKDGLLRATEIAALVLYKAFDHDAVTDGGKTPPGEPLPAETPAS